MGNRDSRLKFYTSRNFDLIYAEINSNLTILENYYSHLLPQDSFIDYETFTQNILSHDQILSTQIFNVLSFPKEKISFDDFIAFFFIFNNPNQKNNIRTLFWLHILFSCKEEISESGYKTNVELFFNNYPDLLNQEFINSFKLKQKGDILNRTLFQRNLGNNKIIKFYSSIESKRYIPSSTLKNFDKNELYICDCLIVEKRMKEEEEKKLYGDKDKRDNISKIEIEFRKIEKNNKGVFTLKEMENILDKMKINKFEKEIFLEYVNNITKNKNIIEFNEFIDILNRVENAKSDEDKINLTFEIISLKKKEIKSDDMNILINQLQLDEKILFDKPLTINDFKQNQNTINNKIQTIFINFFSTFNLIPYIIFNCSPKTPTQIKKCIDFYCNGKRIDEIDPQILLNQESVFCLDTNFIQSLYKYLSNSQKEKVPTINLIGFLKDYQLCKEYKKDFIVVQKELYYLIKSAFNYKDAPLEFKKIEYDIKENVEEYKSKNKDTLKLYSEDNGHFKEIEFFKWKVYMFDFKFFYNEFIQKQLNPKDYIDIILSEFKNKEKRAQMTSKINTIQNTLNYISKKLVNFKNMKVYFIKNNEIFNTELDRTIQQCGENGNCYLLIDREFIDHESEIVTCSYDALFKREEFLKLKEKGIKEKEERKKREKEEREKRIKELKKKEEEEKKEKEIEKEKEKNKVNNKQNNIEDNNTQINLQKNKQDNKEIKNSKIIGEVPEEKFLLPFGLDNIGNTCYMNSVLQILLNLPILRDILTDERIKYFINRKSKFSHNGKFIDLFLKFITYRWTPRSKRQIASINTKPIKQLSGKIQSQFDNSAQQDASEYLNFVIDELHEELNIKHNSPYIHNIDDCFSHNTEEEISNLYWANSLRKTASFIHAIFSFQLKSVLTCSKCNKHTISYETNTDLYVPVPMGEHIEINVTLYKLPIGFKIYYEKLNDEYKKFKENVYKERGMEQECLNEFFGREKERDEMVYAGSVAITLVIDKKKRIADFIDVIRSYGVLEFERGEESSLLTTFIVYNIGNNGNINFLYDDMTIDESFPNNSKVFVYEVLNSKGIEMAKGEKQKKVTILNNTNNTNTSINTTNNTSNNSANTSTNNTNTNSLNDDKEESKIISLSRYLYYQKKNRFYEISSLFFEFPIKVLHFKQQRTNYYLFTPFDHIELPLKKDYILFNNTPHNFSGRELYEYIWEKNKIFLKNKNKKNIILWWRTPNSNNKNCSPFTLKLCKSFNGKYLCSKCKWYNFCSGCIINPSEAWVEISDVKDFIMVEWCCMFEEREIDRSLIAKKFALVEKEKNYSNSNKSNIPSTIQPEKSIYDCIYLFLEKEILEDELKCSNCNIMRPFYKNYQFDKLPPILFITLKRFKFTSVFHNKINTYIKFPINDFKINSEIFDLYGVINHFGSLNGGHYTSTIKIDNKWFYFNDSNVYEVKEDRVISINAYILVYINKKPIESQMYLNVMRSIMNKINIKECDEFFNKKEEQSLIFKGDEIFGVPVNTIYGKGYFVKRRDDGFIEVKLSHGKGTIREVYNGKRQIENENFLSVEKSIKSFKEVNFDDITKFDKEKYDYNKGYDTYYRKAEQMKVEENDNDMQNRINIYNNNFSNGIDNFDYVNDYDYDNSERVCVIY